MFLNQLSLLHFRNYQQLDLEFGQPLTLVQGNNAQGKTNLLEAIYFLATSKSSHAHDEQEVVDWNARLEPIPFCRISGTLHHQGRDQTLEVFFVPREDGTAFKKQVRINGANKRNMDLIGRLRVVLFLPSDIILISGSPGERRRYLDIALCQIDRTYCQHLARFQKVVSQRNSLLKNLREQGTNPGSRQAETQLEFWDDRLVHHGSAIMSRRHEFIQVLAQLARRYHADLTGDRERLFLRYLPSFNPGHLSDSRLQERDMEQLSSPHGFEPEPPVAALTLQEQYRTRLASARSREIGAGASLYGPHRDDLRFLANGHDLRSYGSRGQQRTAALALKLSEAQAMTVETGEAPLLLLDDVMSELDAHRRATLLTALDGVNQAVLTTTDWSDFSPAFLAQAQLIHVEAGRVEPFTVADTG